MDENLALLQQEKVDLLKRLEEDQEDLNELMKKHKALIAQVLLFSLNPSYPVDDLNHHSLQVTFSCFVPFSPPVILPRSENCKLNWRS